ncbi:MAG: hypothetical protein MJZ16_05460 [Bacteroidales bacterium]|nr:hypothetical protein [Bacteroidales bacterium]
MKHIFRILSNAAVIAISTFAMSSCEFLNNDDHFLSSASFVTIANEGGNTIFFMDGGGVIKPTKESVNKITDNKGFGDYKRAYMYFNYYKNELDYSEEKKEYTVNNADITFGRFLDMGQIKTLEQAQAENLFLADSVYKLDSFEQIWVYRGYLNVIGKGSYVLKNDAGIKPTVSLVYNPADVTDNTIKFNLLYNRHAPKDAISYSVYDLINSFDITSLEPIIPGTDSVKVTVETEGAKSLSYKFARKDFRFRESVND